MSDIAIRIQGVNKRFGETHAVRDLDLEVPAGSLCGFLGPNGAGKSTTIRMIMSIIYPDGGSIDVLGGTALNSKDRIGYLPEERGVYRKMRVGDFLIYMGKLKGIPGSDMARRVPQWLKRVDLEGVERKKCEELSKGMQQKVQFLAAVIHEPELLILDEPFSGLDPVNADLIRNLVDEIHAGGTTIIFSTHVLHQAEQVCDRIFLINKGIKLLDATMQEIHHRFDPRTIVAEPLNGRVDIAGVPGVHEARALRDSSAFELEMDPNVDAQQVMSQLLARQELRSVALRRLTLEEVFVQMVMREAGEEAAETAREELSHA